MEIQYSNFKNIAEKKGFLSYKNDWKTSLRGLVFIDCLEMITYYTPLKRGAYSEQKFFKEVPLNTFMQPHDMLFMDGAFLESIKFHQDIQNNNIDEKQIQCPIRKVNNVPQDISELDFNSKFGGLRSIIETYFSHIQATFELFKERNYYIRNEKILEILTLKWGLCNVLYGIKKAVEHYSLKIIDLHMEWINENWDFPFLKQIKQLLFYQKHFL